MEEWRNVFQLGTSITVHTRKKFKIKSIDSNENENVLGQTAEILKSLIEATQQIMGLPNFTGLNVSTAIT